MKTTPSSILSGLVNDVATPYLILEMEFASGTIRLTNLGFNVTVGGLLYLADGGLTELSPPQLSSVLDREVYRIKLVDFANEYKSTFENNALGTPVTVSLGLEGNYTDLDIVYKGRIDATSIETNPEEGTKEAIIECSSPFGALDRTTDRRTDRKTQKQIDSTDTCFDNIYANADEIALRWGK